MNIVNFNDAFEPCVRSVHNSEQWKLRATSPLFQHGIQIDRAQKAWDDMAAPEFELKAPYPIMRVSIRVSYRGSGFADNSEVEFFAAVKDNAYELFVHPRGFNKFMSKAGKNAMKMMARIQYFPDTDEMEIGVWNMDESRWINPKTEKLDYVLFDDNGVPVVDKSGDQGRALRNMMRSYVALFTTFARDAMAPTNHIAMVSPNSKEPRSVEWTKARTHYTIITHDHPANKKEVKHSERVTDDQKGELTRMAHNRRAHYKTLRHPRYRFARGQRIFVRATWVGPKEWQDEGGRQIYKILELADQEVAA